MDRPGLQLIISCRSWFHTDRILRRFFKIQSHYSERVEHVPTRSPDFSPANGIRLLRACVCSFSASPDHGCRERSDGRRSGLQGRCWQGRQIQTAEICSRFELCKLQSLSGQARCDCRRLRDIPRQAGGSQGLVFGLGQESLSFRSAGPGRLSGKRPEEQIAHPTLAYL